MTPSPCTPIDIDLLHRYLDRVCGADECRVVEHWIRTTPQAAALVCGLRDDATPITDADVAQIWDQIQQRLDERAMARPSFHRAGALVPSGGHVYRHLYAGLACLGAVALIAGVARWGQRAHASHATSHMTRALATYATATGQRANITLADGSHVTLAPQTTLWIAPDLTLHLDGEAYFAVAHVTNRPFVVRTGGVSTRVLGTAFTVRRYDEESRTRVAVLTGKVAVSASSGRQPTVTVAAGDVAEATDSTAIAVQASDMAPSTGWLDGHIVLNGASVGDALVELQRWYGFSFRLADSSMARQRVTVSLSTQSAQEALSSLKAVLNVDLVFKENLVIIVPRSKRSVPSHHNDPLRRTSEVGR
jgi:ferric-dicitrate binding protein FerR (iron transport regulator)